MKKLNVCFLIIGIFSIIVCSCNSSVKKEVNDEPVEIFDEPTSDTLDAMTDTTVTDDELLLEDMEGNEEDIE